MAGKRLDSMAYDGHLTRSDGEGGYVKVARGAAANKEVVMRFSFLENSLLVIL
jgi:hypothetical protein